MKRFVLFLLAIIIMGSSTVGAENLDDQLREAIKYEPLHRTAGMVTHLGDGAVTFLIGQGLRVKNPEGGRKATEAFLVSGLVTQAIKSLTGRARPYAGASEDFRGITLDSDYHSFPSGHTSSAFSLAHILANEYPEYKVLFYLTAGLVGWSRIELDMHWPSDVAVGAVVGILSAEFVLRLDRPLFQLDF